MNQFSERQSAHIIKQLLVALNFMHTKSIMHRDIKPENILCEESYTDSDELINIKLIDFGFAKKYSTGNKDTLFVGTPLYMAPELCRQTSYDNKVDVWAVGVLAYILLSGKPAFKSIGRKPEP